MTHLPPNLLALSPEYLSLGTDYDEPLFYTTGRLLLKCMMLSTVSDANYNFLRDARIPVQFHRAPPNACVLAIQLSDCDDPLDVAKLWNKISLRFSIGPPPKLKRADAPVPQSPTAMYGDQMVNNLEGMTQIRLIAVPGHTHWGVFNTVYYTAVDGDARSVIIRNTENNPVADKHNQRISHLATQQHALPEITITVFAPVYFPILTAADNLIDIEQWIEKVSDNPEEDVWEDIRGRQIDTVSNYYRPTVLPDMALQTELAQEGVNMLATFCMDLLHRFDHSVE